jgi:gas vesicle protein
MPRKSDAVKAPIHDAPPKPSPTMARVKDLAGETATQAVKTVRKGADIARKQTTRATKNAAAGIDDAKIKASKAVDTANRLITEHPIAATAAAVAAGAVFAYLFPRSAKTLRAAAPKVYEAIQAKAKDAQDAAKAMLPVAEMAALSEAVTETARKAPGIIMDAMRDGAEKVKDTAETAKDATEDFVASHAPAIREQAADLTDRAGKAAGGAISRVRQAATRMKR